MERKISGVSPSSVDTSPIGSEPCPMTSFNFSYLFKECVSKYRPIRSRASTYDFGRTQFSPYQIVIIRMAPSFAFRVLIFTIVMKPVSGSSMKSTYRTSFNFHAF